MRHKLGDMGDLKRPSGLENLGGREFWFGRKSLRHMALNSITNVFWFGTFGNFLEMLGR
jgi:hypothetical protein